MLQASTHCVLTHALKTPTASSRPQTVFRNELGELDLTNVETTKALGKAFAA